MATKNPLDEMFPGHRREIDALRQGDPSFDELCTDFEDLYSRIPMTARNYSAAIESLHGLEREIRERLEPKTPNPKADR
ncbi:MAG: hypothetical protein AAGG56_06960 [Pseudomonadota bacterium]